MLVNDYGCTREEVNRLKKPDEVEEMTNGYRPRYWYRLDRVDIQRLIRGSAAKQQENNNLAPPQSSASDPEEREFNAFLSGEFGIEPRDFGDAELNWYRDRLVFWYEGWRSAPDLLSMLDPENVVLYRQVMDELKECRTLLDSLPLNASKRDKYATALRIRAIADLFYAYLDLKN